MVLFEIQASGRVSVPFITIFDLQNIGCIRQNFRDSIGHGRKIMPLQSVITASLSRVSNLTPIFPAVRANFLVESRSAPDQNRNNSVVNMPKVINTKGDTDTLMRKETSSL